MLTYIYNIIIYPLEMLVEFFYVVLMKVKPVHGISIAGLSILVSILALPLYNKAEAIQKLERDTRKKLQPQINRIKSVFKGDEQYMILNTLYRQKHYHPLYSFRSSPSILIQVPIFIAAYRFLNNLEALHSSSFLFISDLGKPDGLITILGQNINLLPFLMTGINLISGYIYSKDFSLRDKLQIYVMAGLFLVLLYNSPAGLVYYWTLNNVFSLIKNLFVKMKNPIKKFYSIVAVSVISTLVYILVTNETITSQKKILLWGFSLLVILIPFEVKVFNIIYEKLSSGGYSHAIAPMVA